jgi:hypothetical protein
MSFLSFASDHEWLLGESVDDQVSSQAKTLMSAPGLAGYDVRNPWTARPTMKSENPASAF